MKQDEKLKLFESYQNEKIKQKQMMDEYKRKIAKEPPINNKGIDLNLKSYTKDMISNALVAVANRDIPDGAHFRIQITNVKRLTKDKLILQVEKRISQNKVNENYLLEELIKQKNKENNLKIYRII
jgi:hypothetical protein